MSETATPRRSNGGARKQTSRKHTVVRVIAVTTVVLALVTGLSVIYGYRVLNGNLEVKDITGQLENRPTKAVVDGPKEPMNILVMGSDARDGDGNNIDGLTGGGERSDTTILLHLAADRSWATGISIPRDSMVERPECKEEDGTVIPASSGMVMFNSAFTIGGPACTVQTVEQLTGIRIDDYVVVDFNGFVGMVDAIGGVEVCIPRDAADPAHGINLQAGTREVRGREALNYVRERHKLSANGDIGRMKRQQAFIASMANKVVSAGTLANPIRLARFLDSATKSLTLGKDLGSISELVELGLEVRGIGLDNVEFITIPMELWEVDRNRVIWTEEADVVWDHIRRDRRLPDGLQVDTIRADAPPGTASPSDDASGAASPDPTGGASPDASGDASGGPSGASSPSPSQTQADAEALAAQHGLCA